MLKHNRSPKAKAKKVKIIKINETQAQFNLNSFLLSVSVVTETSQNTKVYLVVEKSVRGAVCGTFSVGLDNPRFQPKSNQVKTVDLFEGFKHDSFSVTFN